MSRWPPPLPLSQTPPAIGQPTPPPTTSTIGQPTPPPLPPATIDQPTPPAVQRRNRHRWPPNASSSPQQPPERTFAVQLRRAASKLKAYAAITGGRPHEATDVGRRDRGPRTIAAAAASAVTVESIVADDTSVDSPQPPPLPPSPPPSPSPPPPSPPLEKHEYRNTPKQFGTNYRRVSKVDFVLAYHRHRKVEGQEDNVFDDETERRRFYRELRANGILVNVDDDPMVSLDAGQTCFALLQLSKRLLGCRCRCHKTSGNDNVEQTTLNTKDVSNEQYSNDDRNCQKYVEKFTSAQRAQIIWRVMLRIGSNNKHNKNVMNLSQLLETGIIAAAYPVHDGGIKASEDEDPNNINDRRVLYEEWARPGLIVPRKWKSDDRIAALIRQYYGLPVAVYFRWLRYYTIWLVGPAIAGLVWFLYGLITTRYDVPTRDICDPRSQVADWLLCPTRRCEPNYCGFTRVHDTCGVYKWTSAATFDRPGTVAFAVFMSFWATAFQQLWTAYGWQITELNDGGDVYTSDRVECCEQCRDKSTNNEPPVSDAAGTTPVTDTAAKRARRHSAAAVLDDGSGWLGRWPRVVGFRPSGALRAVVFLWTLMAVAVVPVLIVVYRGRAIGWLMSTVFHQDVTDDGRLLPATAAAGGRHRRHSFFLLNYADAAGEMNNWKTAVAAMCAAFVQLAAIVAVHRGYSAVAEWLTKYSYRNVYDPRFQSRYTAYMSCFDSANYYSSLVYIAFFKGRFVTGRGYSPSTSTRLLNFWPISLIRRVMIHVREDVCDPAAVGTGCVPELCIQLAIIMVGKQMVDNIIELSMPLSLNIWRRWRAKESRRKEMHGKMSEVISETIKHPKQWQLDYQLEDTGPMGLYQEYSEMVIQFGFVVMFTTAFPLTPLCALLNNILEQRLDAYKMVAAQRRPVPAYFCTKNDDLVKSQVVTYQCSRQTSPCCDSCVKMGTWIRVLKVLSTIAVIYNAFMIAFTSDLLPRYVYTHLLSETTSSSSPLEGYVAWSLSSKRNMTEYYLGKSDDMDVCRYKGYGSDTSTKQHSGDYTHWQVLAVRLIFVFVFEHCVLAATAIMAYAIRKAVAKYISDVKTFDNEPSADGDNEPVIRSIAKDPPFLAAATPNGVVVNTVNNGKNDDHDVHHVPKNAILNDVKNQRIPVGNCPSDRDWSSPMIVVDIENDERET